MAAVKKPRCSHIIKSLLTFSFSDNKLLVNVCAKVGLLYCVEDVCKSSTSMFLNNQYPVL